eukprot:CAMPEP_0194509702 /NCGR_PEP_ID=MMETSP0253-20130528/40692_1 /TAXON_ID=2966 /ORGANISM="Noctiluca scintillans" /LENGTH=102 /DNA_ID=CAMNT_0039352883 /DNA_START=74 /DNA_END=382 /DNA_ORIENTATION=-
MIAYHEIVERRRQEELKCFRRYLADSGLFECLVKMYKHIGKDELRTDNPRAVVDFLVAHMETHADEEEIRSLLKANQRLKELNRELDVRANLIAEKLQEPEA